jgi:hypothetical protein
MTTLNVNLSPELQQELGQKGVYAYAAYFTNSGTTLGSAVTLADGSGHVSSTTELPLPSIYNGGKVYFIIQSGQPQPLFGPNGVIKQESDLSIAGGPTAADALDYRFDSFELSLLSSGSDVGNLTEVNGFGIPMAVVVDYNNGTSASRGYNVSGSDIWQLVSAAHAPIEKFTSGPLSGLDRMAASPAAALGDNISGGYSSSDWDNYIGSLENNSATSAGDPHQIQVVATTMAARMPSTSTTTAASIGTV